MEEVLNLGLTKSVEHPELSLEDPCSTPWIQVLLAEYRHLAPVYTWEEKVEM